MWENAQQTFVMEEHSVMMQSRDMDIDAFGGQSLLSGNCMHVVCSFPLFNNF